MDGETYGASLERFLALEITILITGQRALRRGAAARAWLGRGRPSVTECFDLPGLAGYRPRLRGRAG